jgi:hypothetical protein
MGPIERRETTLQNLRSEWETKNARLGVLRQALAVEASPDRRFQLERQIQTEEQEIERSEQEIRRLESQLPNIGQPPNSSSTSSPPTSRGISQEGEIAFLRFVVLFLLAAVAVWVFHTSLNPATNTGLIRLRPSCDTEIGDNLSCGEELLSDDNRPFKEKLINTLKNRENLNQQKLDELKASWKREGGRDPEALIYINNAKAQIQQSKDKPVKTIAVAVPLSNSVSFSQGIGTEILRGVAQVQETANNNNENLQVLIANDKNDPDPQNGAAVAVANDVATRGVLAVIGHYSSGVTKVVLPIYEQHGLTMISPTSTASDLSVWGSEPDHVFLELHLQLKMLPYN